MWLALHPLAEDCSAGGWCLSDAWSLKTSQLKREKEIVIFFIHTHVKTEIMLYKDFTVSLNLNTISPAIGIGNYFFHSRYSKWLSSDMHTYILLRCVKKKRKKWDLFKLSFRTISKIYFSIWEGWWERKRSTWLVSEEWLCLNFLKTKVQNRCFQLKYKLDKKKQQNSLKTPWKNKPQNYIGNMFDILLV